MLKALDQMKVTNEEEIQYVTLDLGDIEPQLVPTPEFNIIPVDRKFFLVLILIWFIH